MAPRRTLYSLFLVACLCLEAAGAFRPSRDQHRQAQPGPVALHAPVLREEAQPSPIALHAPVLREEAARREDAEFRPEMFVELLAGSDTPGGVHEPSPGNVMPQLKRPWGFNDWVPQTNDEGHNWWFRRQDTQFFGMRCTHQPSPWIGDYASFLLTPHFAALPSSGELPPLEYSSSESTFLPHLFKASLRESVEGAIDFEGGAAIDFEFTATSRAAIARVSFNDGHHSPVGYVSLVVQEGGLRVDGGLVKGVTKDFSHRLPRRWEGMFFVLKPLSAPRSVEVTSGGRGSVVTLEFSTGEGAVALALGTSFLSAEQAELNLERELAQRPFEDIVVEGQREWRSLLGRVRVETLGDDEQQLRVFYTNLWRAQLFPRELHEVNAAGELVHKNFGTGEVVPGRYVTDSGFWDSYKTVYVLQSIVAPEQYPKTIEGWAGAADDAGWLPQWSSPDELGNMMVGTMGDVVLADAIAKSKWGLVDGLDLDKLYQIIRKDAFHDPEGSSFGRAGVTDYVEMGYVPHSLSEESVALTLGYYAADAAIANAASALGLEDDAVDLAARSKRYSTLFNPQTKFFQPKDAQGSWEPGFDPLAWREGFTEANAWHYRFDVPHDVEGLKTLYGGDLCSAVKDMMAYDSEDVFHVGGYHGEKKEMTEAAALKDGFGQYAHSNQPVHSALWIAKKAGCNAVADEYLRKVLGELYTTKGWSGDEDNGEMGAWYVLAALGIYQLEGGRDEVVLGSPSVVAATLQLARGKVLSIEAQNQSTSNVYTQKVRWAPASGESRFVEGNVAKFTELMGGGTLTFFLGDSPQT